MVTIGVDDEDGPGMATYTYRCAIDGPVDVRRPIGTAPATVPCPACGAHLRPG